MGLLACTEYMYACTLQSCSYSSVIILIFFKCNHELSLNHALTWFLKFKSCTRFFCTLVSYKPGQPKFDSMTVGTKTESHLDSIRRNYRLWGAVDYYNNYYYYFNNKEYIISYALYYTCSYYIPVIIILNHFIVTK